MLYSDYLVDVLNGKDLKLATEETAKKVGLKNFKKTVESSYDEYGPMSACYIDSNFPAMLHFNYRYSHSLEEALLANVNAGGENVARGSLMGALFGAAKGMKGLPEWSMKLHE